ncbi:MAG: PPC domain-containing DNA-binding protein [Cyclobacteriaceae bacterium]
MKTKDSFAQHSTSRIYAIRLRPGEDLKDCLEKFATENRTKAAVIITCVGSLGQYNLRYANQKEACSGKGHFEIVSLVGTLSESSAHLHLSISDESGITTGGHLLDKNIIYTTAEIAIAELTDLIFDRQIDETSGYRELQIRKK